MDRQCLTMVVVAAVVSIFLLFSGRLNGDVSGQAARTVSSEPSGWVRISGDVRFPGVYPIYANVLTYDVMSLAQPLCDVSQAVKSVYGASGSNLQVVCVGRNSLETIISSPMHVHECLVLNIPVDLNRATAGDLEAIPGIGPVMAQRIIRYRQKNGEFRGIEELGLVDGVGEKKVEQLSGYLQITKIKETP